MVGPGPLSSGAGGRVKKATTPIPQHSRISTSRARPTSRPRSVARPRSSAVGKDIALVPAKQVELGAVGQEIEALLGQFRPAFALEQRVEMLLQRV